MSEGGSDNPFQSPEGAASAAPWRNWRVWWGGSLVLVVVALSLMLVSAFLSAAMVVGALAVSLRSAIELNRKFQAGFPIHLKTQFDAIASSFIILIAASVAGFIAFFISCFSMAEVTEAPMGEVGLRWNTVQSATIMAISVAIGVGIFGLISRLPGPLSKIAHQTRCPEIMEAESTDEERSSDV